MLLVLGSLHGWAIWLGMGGLEGLRNPWPLARHDHPLYFHSALVTRDFLRQNGTTAGYDPSFMSGYAKSVVFPASSTLPELVVFLFGNDDPVRAYKLYVLVSAAAIPWLLIAAGLLWRVPPPALAIALVLFLVYVWTDFPIHYATFGMLPYLLAIPLGVFALATVTWYLDRGGFGRWLVATVGCVAVVLVHLTSAMVVAPAAALAYVAAVVKARLDGNRLTPSRHLGVWLIPVLVLALNAFWWWPGICLASTKGPSDFAFSHSREGILIRLAHIVEGKEPLIQLVLWTLGLPGLVVWVRRKPLAGTGLFAFIAAGFFWGYAAAAIPSLDFLQPGRHTFAFYTGVTIAAGIGLEALLARLSRTDWRPDRVVLALLIIAGTILFEPPLAASLNFLLQGPEPFLSSRPRPRLIWILKQVRGHMRPGERLYYEESGFAIAGLTDPYADGRYSGLLPHLTGVEVIGGPYLHASSNTNFTQFGEGKLFGKTDWNREDFVRYAKLYRPSGILCWTPRARAFCRENPDLIEIVPGGDEGRLLFGRVRGFGGSTIEGDAEVRASPGRLEVRAGSGDLDGRIVLRYHTVPCLRSRPTVPIEPVWLEDDPVPFIGLRPGSRSVTLELDTTP